MSQKYSKKRSKIDSLMPVDSDFWNQFSREFGMSRYIYNLYSEYRWAIHIADLSKKLLDYITMLDADKDEKIEPKLKEVVERIPACLKDLDYWLYHCLEVGVVGNDGNAVTDSMGKVVTRDIGFYHLRRQNLFPIGTEMFVLVEGFTTPITNEDYSKMRQIALNGDMNDEGIYEGGVKRVVLTIETIFHRILEIEKNKKYEYKKEELLIGDEQQAKQLSEEEAEIIDVASMMKELRTTYEENHGEEEGVDDIVD